VCGCGPCSGGKREPRAESLSLIAYSLLTILPAYQGLGRSVEEALSLSRAVADLDKTLHTKVTVTSFKEQLQKAHKTTSGAARETQAHVGRVEADLASLRSTVCACEKERVVLMEREMKERKKRKKERERESMKSLIGLWVVDVRQIHV
jgi:hypothetical protein